MMDFQSVVVTVSQTLIFSEFFRLSRIVGMSTVLILDNASAKTDSSPFTCTILLKIEKCSRVLLTEVQMPLPIFV